MGAMAVCHMEKGSGSTGGMQGHNERTYDVKNADPNKADLNFYVNHNKEKKRIECLSNNPRTGSYKQREGEIIDKRHTGRKIRDNAVKRLSFALSGSHEQMLKIEAEGKIKQWAMANYKFFGQKYGYKNITEFAVHMDERTPHIHCMLVPMVKTEKGEKLCAKDLTSRDQLRDLQDEYAEAMKPYGLERGLRGSRATHDTTAEYYAKIHAEKGELENIRNEKEELYHLRDDAKDKFLNVGSMALSELKKETKKIESQLTRAKNNKGISF